MQSYPNKKLYNLKFGEPFLKSRRTELQNWGALIGTTCVNFVKLLCQTFPSRKHPSGHNEGILDY